MEESCRVYILKNNISCQFKFQLFSCWSKCAIWWYVTHLCMYICICHTILHQPDQTRPDQPSPTQSKQTEYIFNLFLHHLPNSSNAHIKTSGAIYGFVPDMLQARPSLASLVAILKSVKCAWPEVIKINRKWNIVWYKLLFYSFCFSLVFHEQKKIVYCETFFVFNEQNFLLNSNSIRILCINLIKYQS